MSEVKRNLVEIDESTVSTEGNLVMFSAKVKTLHTEMLV